MSYIHNVDNGNEVGTNNPLPVTTITNDSLAFRKLASADTNLAVIKATKGKLFSLNITNVSAATKFLKLYNKSTNPVLASDVPVVTIPVSANASLNHTFAGNIGLTFTNGISMSLTGALADNDTTALAVNDVILTLVYS